LIDICIWSLTDQNRTAKVYSFPQDDEGRIKIPQTAVEEEYKRLFGEPGPATHESVQGADYEFEYVAADKAYYIPVTGQLAIYSPYVRNVDKRGNSVTLTVDYLSEDDWQIDADDNDPSDGGNRPEAVKTMLITLYEQDGSLVLGSIQNPQQQITVVGSTRVGAAAATTTALTEEEAEEETAEQETAEQQTTSKKDS